MVFIFTSGSLYMVKSFPIAGGLLSRDIELVSED